MQVTFHGAAQTVTGSCHEVAVAGKRILLDCGMFQGPRDLARQINSTFDFSPADINLVILSHGHVDHCGNLPTLVKNGFKGSIYATPATIALTAWMLLDGAKIQQETAAHLAGQFPPNQAPPVTTPLFSQADAEETISRFKPIEYNAPTNLDGFSVTFQDAGHLLGSATVSLSENPNSAAERILVFSGDVGRPIEPLLHHPNPFTKAHAFISECTYGGRWHPPSAQIPVLLTQIINETINRRGTVLIPAFALGRTQSLEYLLHQLYLNKQIPQDLPIYVDSPLANHLTDVFKRFGTIMDEESQKLPQPFEFPTLHYVGSPDESKALNSRRDPCIIIASSGMCESGRILHHLKHHIAYPQNTVILAGFQAPQTLGRKLQDHLAQVPILNQMIPLRARVERLDGLSSHADESELLTFTEPLKQNASPPRIYLVHGELDSARAHQGHLQAAGFPKITIPARKDTFTV